MMTKKAPIGISDFRKIVEGNFYYVDKTMFIREIVDASAEALLFSRPRRFGKTLNVSMLRYFFEKGADHHRALFTPFAISRDECFEKHLNQYPVIFITFKDIKARQWSDCRDSIYALISEAFSGHRYLLENDALYPDEKRLFQSIIDRIAPAADYARSLRLLCAYLERYHSARTVILIDEYDTPLHAGVIDGYYDEIIHFMREFLSSGFKDNVHLFKGVLTGIMRIAKESIFSGLNNLDVYTLLDKGFHTAFGFTEKEVAALLTDFGIPETYDEVSRWYNGYVFGGETVSNPWSVLKYVNSPDRKLRPYWINTGETELIDRLATSGGKELKEEIGLLLEGKSVIKPVFRNIVIRDLESGDDLLWSFLLFSGYLKAVEELDFENWRLEIPNHEIYHIYRNLVRSWFADKIASSTIENLLSALLDGRTEDFEYLFSEVAEQVFSVHDIGGDRPERFYHAFVLGLLVWLEGTYQVKSNRESGLGRYDVMLIPKTADKPGIILEFKKVNPKRKETPDQVLNNALKQMEQKHYAADLKQAGITDIRKLAIAFQGKSLWVREGASRPTMSRYDSLKGPAR